MIWYIYVIFIFLVIPSIEPRKIYPVIFVPGDGGSQVDAKLNKTEVVHYICTKTTDDFFNIWLNLELLVPLVIDCWVDNTRLVYDNVTRTTSNSPGVELRIPGWGDPFVVEWLDPSKASSGSYFKYIGDAMVALGWKRNVSIRGAPYDFRKAPNENQEFFVKLKALVEETYTANNNTAVVLLAHSMGGPMSLYFLHQQSQQWKDQYIRAMVSLSGAWGGSAKAIKVYAVGDDLGVYVLRQSVLRNMQITAPSLAWLLPSSLFWKPDEVLVETYERNYTWSDMKDFFQDIDYEVAWEMWKDVYNYTLDFTAPGVEVHCLHGYNVKTVEKLVYKKGKFPEGSPSFVFGDGDGTVNKRSLEGCLHWKGNQKQPVYHQTFPDMDHMDVLSDDRIIDNKSKCSRAASVQDISPPWDAPLSAKYMRSFAYVTVKDRLPVILTKVIDGLSRDKESIAAVYGEEGREDVKRVIGCLSQLKNEMVTDKCFTQLVCGEDASKWNVYWQNKTENSTTVSWFKTEWLYAECYLYRRIKESFLLSKKLGDYDPFHKQKTDAVEEALNSMDIMATYLIKLLEDRDIRWDTMHSDFQRMLKHSLWANRADLSLSSGNHVEIKGDPFKLLDELNEFILIDNTREIWVELSKSSVVKDLIIDIVLDNTGLEVMMDLCLADYLTTMYNTVRVRFHCKAIPWFVSDVMEKDFHQAIERLANHTPACQNLATRWRNYLNQGKWSVHSELFWTQPFTFNEMKEQDPKLYSMLTESSIIIFKGDLNYRKLLGDINWKYTTPFHTALRGFNPAPLVALRTAKADLIAGLDPHVFEPIAAKNRNWLVTGDYGLIQFDGTNSKNNVEGDVTSEIKKLAL